MEIEKINFKEKLKSFIEYRLNVKITGIQILLKSTAGDKRFIKIQYEYNSIIEYYKIEFKEEEYPTIDILLITVCRGIFEKMI